MTRQKIQNPERRRFAVRAAYVAPAILTLKAAPAYARSGSQRESGPPWSGGPGGPPWSGGPGGPSG